MTEEQFVKVYSSSQLIKRQITEDKDKRAFLDLLIDAIGSTSSYDIKRVDTNRNGDLIMAVGTTAIADNLIKNGRIYFDFGGKSVFIPCGPLVDPGLINHLRYEVHIRPPPGMVYYDVLQTLLHEGLNVLEVVVNDQRSLILESGPVNTQGFTIYVRMNSEEEALNLPRNFETKGGEYISLNHKGVYTCDTCGRKGHSTSSHGYITRLEKQREKRRARTNYRRTVNVNSLPYSFYHFKGPISKKRRRPPGSRLRQTTITDHWGRRARIEP